MKFTKHLSLISGITFFLIASSFAQSSSGKLSLSKGQKFQVNNDIKSVVSQEMAGQSIEITIDANMIHQLEVKDKKDKSYVISSTLTKLTTNGNAMGQTISFDSDKKEDLETETGKAMKGQLNVPNDVELSDEAKVINAAKNEETPANGGQLMDMINNVTGGGASGGNGANAAFEVMPAGKKVGDSWSDSTITDEIKTYRTYTIKDVKGNDATVSITGNQVTKKKVEQQGMEINVNMDGKISGEGIVDISTGILKERTTLMEGTGTAEMMGQSIPVTTKITTKTIVTSN
jgi:hypothetical protein